MAVGLGDAAAARRPPKTDAELRGGRWAPGCRRGPHAGGEAGVAGGPGEARGGLRAFVSAAPRTAARRSLARSCPLVAALPPLNQELTHPGRGGRCRVAPGSARPPGLQPSPPPLLPPPPLWLPLLPPPHFNARHRLAAQPPPGRPQPATPAGPPSPGRGRGRAGGGGRVREGREGPGSKPGLEGRDRGRGGGGGGGPGRAEWGARWRPGARASVMSRERERRAGGRPSVHNARRPAGGAGRTRGRPGQVRAGRAEEGQPGDTERPGGTGRGHAGGTRGGRTQPDVAGVESPKEW